MQSVSLRCKCGVSKLVRVSDVLVGDTRSCRSCSSRDRMLALPLNVRVAMAAKASQAATDKLRDTPSAHASKYGRGVVNNLRLRMQNAKNRCVNNKAMEYANYGGRGIEFRFPSALRAAEWILDNIGPCPSKEYSIDRIDNNRHYEPGNLRWATRTEQGRNKRQYKRSTLGDRYAMLCKLRPDLTYETIRTWVKKGRSDSEILNRRKYVSSGI